MSIHDLLPHDIRAASEAVFRKANQGVPDAAPPQDPDAQLPAGVPEDAHAAVAGALGGDRPEPAGSGRGVGTRGAVYLAGPMRGHVLYNFPAFDAAAELWRKQGWDVISPAELDRQVGFDETTDAATPEFMRGAMRRDLEAMLAVDAIVLLDGWQNSRGARAELAIAQWRGIPAYDWRTGLPAELPISLEAAGLVYGDRREAYGHPADDYARVVGAFNALTGLSLTTAQGAIFMLCVKLARETHRPKRDNRVDIGGYAEVLDLIRQREAVP